MKKIVRYMQNQATSYSDTKFSSAAYLNAGGKEPQQRVSRHPHHYKSQHEEFASRRISHPSAHAHSVPHHTSGASGPYPIPRDVQRIQYGSDNILQSYEIYIPNPTPGAHVPPSSKEDDDQQHHNDDAPPAYEADQQQQQQQHLPIRTKPDLTTTSFNPSSGTHTPTPKYWIIYIHSGYFRDPRITATSFHSALAQLINPHHSNPRIREIQPHIAGYASINYRLSPNDRFPQDEKTDDYEKRNAKWPEPLDDVLSALAHLQGKHGFGERYLLVGHSVGATMALLATLKCHEKQIPAPLAVLGVAGIYDFQKLHETWPGYDALTKNAGMQTEEVWKGASPALVGRERFEKEWARGRKRWVVLAQSRGDGMVDFKQAEEMNRVFDDDDDVKTATHGGGGGGGGGEDGEGEGKKGGEAKHDIICDLMEIEGKHNQIWEQGEQLVKAIGVGVGEMMGLDQ